MRPAGEIRAVLLEAVHTLALPERGPTLAELTAHTQVGELVARRTLDNMRRGGHVRIARTRRVDYRNRPVAEYAPPEEADTGAGFVDLGQVLSSAWR